MEQIQVIKVNKKDNSLEIKTFGNLDEQDSEGTELAIEFFEEVLINSGNLTQEEIEIYLEDGYYDCPNFTLNIVHTFPENIQY